LQVNQQFGCFLNRTLILVAVALFVCGCVWNYSTRKYLNGFSDAIVPLEGSLEKKSEALLGWFRDEPERRGAPVEGTNPRDPVGIVQDARLLKVCGSASNAFVNLAEAAGLRTRRLLLLDASGRTKHVVVEVKWDERWVVIDPSFRAVFRDHTGRALSKEDPRRPEVFNDAIISIPGYKPTYTFEHRASSFDANSCPNLLCTTNNELLIPELGGNNQLGLLSRESFTLADTRILAAACRRCLHSAARAPIRSQTIGRRDSWIS
jgi:hypothetical protein